MDIVLIGVGGVGSWVAQILARYLEFRGGSRPTMTLVDGDAFEAGNRNRQPFDRSGNKARRTVERLAAEFENVSFRAVEQYVDAGNLPALVRDGAIVLMAVDNHATRKLVSEHCQELQEVTLLSGGNELTDGNVQVYVKRAGEALNVPLTAFHPEIANHADTSPAERGCDVLLEAGEPQLIFTNVAVGSALLNAFYTVVELGRIDYDEVYLDVTQARMTPVRRGQQPQ